MVFCANVYSEQVGKNAVCELLVHYMYKLVIVFEDIMELFPLVFSTTHIE